MSEKNVPAMAELEGLSEAELKEVSGAADGGNYNRGWDASNDFGRAGPHARPNNAPHGGNEQGRANGGVAPNSGPPWANWPRFWR
ncbi:MAG TPA: hypothetical protein VGG33_24915 [Polyangia bacterium]